MTGRSLIASRALTLGLGLLFGLVVITIYMPIAVMAVFSFNSGRYQTLPFRQPTLDWYAQLARDQSFLDGLINSLIIALGAAILATTIGFLAAYAFQKARLPGKPVFLALILAPLVVPLMLIGIGMRLQLTAMGLQPSLWFVLFGQTVYVLPLAVLNLRARLAHVPSNLEEAATSLGASRTRAIVEIVAPACAPTLIATVLLTFTFAFDEFVIAYFLTNFQLTLPIKIWTTLVTGFDPKINAVGTMVFLFSLTLGVIAQWVLLLKQPSVGS
ncbi:MAG: ABC transporter permease [Pseudomonadota bacterium]